MPGKISRRLVIDTSVTSASSDKPDPTASICREFLIRVYDLRHQMVVSSAIKAEFDRHRSPFAFNWYVRMKRAGLIHQIDIPIDRKRLAKALSIAQKAEEFEAIDDDFHLLEAAVATDKMIVSRDEIARRFYAKTTGRIGEFRTIVWVNPENKDELALSWLEIILLRDKDPKCKKENQQRQLRFGLKAD